MRCSYEEHLKLSDSYVITGDAHHHLVHVVRIEQHEVILLSNGEGLQVEAKVESISKKEVRLKHQVVREQQREFAFDLALGIPKKEALELCLKQATELGFKTIYLIRSDYSQTKLPDADRLKSLLVSALEQSNAPFLPKLIPCGWEDVPWDLYSCALMLDSQTKVEQKKIMLGQKENQLLIVGPEGGFSSSEISFLHAVEKIHVVHLPTPILRSPTALATGAGYLLKSLLD
jgi:16S rRNA (uracil1498-N3)-methyltransferase